MAAVLYLNVILELATVPSMYASFSTPREVDCSRLCILNETCHRYWSSVSRERPPRSANSAVSTTTTTATTTAPTTTSTPKTTTTTITATADKDLCPTADGYIFVQNPILCFKLSIKSDTRSYAEAESVCDKDGRLISLDSAEKYNCIHKHITNLGIAAFGSDLCPTADGYIFVQNPILCFKLSIKSGTRSYAEAESVCDKNGRLISLDSAEKYNCIHKHITNLGIAAFGSDAENIRMWVGLKKNTANIFKWPTGSAYIHQWAPGEPDLQVNQRCGQLNSEGLTDMWCSRARRYMCEIPMTRYAEIPKTEGL